jgi:putative restriction endonuclease
MAKAPAVKWTREHFLIALNLYCKIKFGKLHKGNPLIIEVAAKMGRTASSLAMKLCNFASLDPVIKAQGKKGLPGATPQDRKVWDAFHRDLATLGPTSEQLVHDLFTRDDDREVDFLQENRVSVEPTSKLIAPIGPTESTAMVKVRRGQQFFRQSVLASYAISCCITGIAIPQMLVASHIKPWRNCTDSERVNPRNGFCLSSLHDAAFDSLLITVDEKLRVVLSKELKSYFPQPTLEENFAPFEGQTIRLPSKLADPDPIFLVHHRQQFAARAARFQNS